MASKCAVKAFRTIGNETQRAIVQIIKITGNNPAVALHSYSALTAVVRGKSCFVKLGLMLAVKSGHPSSSDKGLGRENPAWPESCQ